MRRIALSAVLLVLGAAAVFAAADKAEVISFTGKAEYQTATGWEAIAVGDTLDQGTVISTGFRSSVVLAIGESRFTVAALSRITISKLTEQDSNYDTEMKLSTGKLRMDVKSKPGKTTAFTVRTPTATASVRGTSGDMYSSSVLQATSGIWTFSATDSKAKPIEVRNTEKADLSNSSDVKTPQQSYQQAAAPAQASTTSLAAAESVAPASAPPSNPTLTEQAAVNVPVANEPVAPSTGSIVIGISLPGDGGTLITDGAAITN